MATRYRHWKLEVDADGLAWLHFDRRGSGPNLLGHDTLGELERILGEAEQSRPRGLVLLSDKPAGFIAGADVHAFTTLADRGEALEAIRRGQALMDRVEGLPFPAVAMIHGHCLGGGLELALACRARVAEREAQLGLPEVRLGIHPGFGGSVRLTRLLGAPAAMDMMLSGRSLRAARAARTGLVDHALPERTLRRAARELALRPPRRRALPLPARLAGTAPVRPLLAAYLRRRVAQRADPRHYPAPHALIELWRRHAGDARGMLRAEAESVADLITGAVARSLVHVFFLQERLKGLGRQPEAAPVRHVHVVGAGAMGGDIAAWCALQGLRVSLQDVRREALGAALARAAALFRRRLREPRAERAALDRLCPDEAGAGTAGADVVIEAIVEQSEAKQALLAELERRAAPAALLATNTSSIPLESLAGALRAPGRLVGLHFFNPVARMPLVEVVAGRHSGEEALARARAFAVAIDRLPLPVRSAPGFLVNRSLMPYLMEALILEGEGVPIERIDRAATDFGMPMGPIRLADSVGLDICLSVAGVLCEAYGGEIPPRLRELVEAGRLGEKSGRGFYDYRGGRPVAPRGGSGGAGAAEVQERLVLRLLNENVACLREGIVDDPDLVDAGMVFGTGFAPFRGGPMRHVRSEGGARLRERLEALARRHGERFTPDPGWRDLESG